MKRKILKVIMTMLIMAFVSITTVEPVLAAETSESSGVQEVDDAMARGENMLVFVVKFIGFGVGLISFIFFLVSFPTHQVEQRIISFIAFVVGVGIYYGPEIMNAILGRSS